MAYRILSTETQFSRLVDLGDLANMISEFYDLEVIVKDADFNPSPKHADIHVVTPNGKTVALFHASIYHNEKHWSLGGSTFAISEDMGELNAMREKEREQ